MGEDFDEIERKLINDLVNSYYNLFKGRISKKTLLKFVVETYKSTDNAKDAVESMEEKLSNLAK